MGGSCSTLNVIEAPTKSTGGLFICGVDALADVERLHSQGIKTIFNMGEESMHNRPSDDDGGPEIRDILQRSGINVRHMNAEDEHGSETDLRPLFAEVADFVEEARKRGGVVVHCRRGVNRSCSGVMAYLMIKQHRTCEAAFAEVHRVRPKVVPLGLFWKYLRDLERTIEASGVTLQSALALAPQQQPPDMAKPLVDKRDAPERLSLTTLEIVRELDREVETLLAKDAIADVFRGCKGEGAADQPYWKLAIEREELGQIMQTLDPGKWDEARVDSLLAQADTNKDGRISVKDFLDWVFGDDDGREAIRKALGNGREAYSEVPLQRRSRAPSASSNPQNAVANATNGRRAAGSTGAARQLRPTSKTAAAPRARSRVLRRP